MKYSDHRDGFENFLRDSSDDFVMVPSRKVWYSIYNDMHPDRRWPSVAVCLLILSAVLYIGVSNNNSLNTAARKNTAENLSGIAESYLQNRRINLLEPVSAIITRRPRKFSLTVNNAANEVLPNGDEKASVAVSDNFNVLPVTDFDRNKETAAKMYVALKFGVGIINGAHNINTAESMPTVSNNTPVNDADDLLKGDVNITALQENKKLPLAPANIDADRAWKDDHAFRNKPTVKKIKQNGSMAYYITPAFGYRGLFFTQSQRNALMVSNGEVTLNDGAALNLELGAVLQYKLSHIVRVKGGLQANYTNYVSNVTALKYPAQTTLAVSNDPNAGRSSEYAVMPGVARLNKTTTQFSMPLGADIKVLGTGNIKWYFGATIQPTYVIGGSAFVLSADGKNYISETALLRKFNMNAALETFVSFRGASGVTVNVGPQLRYQLMSTYKKEYNYVEKLYNVGLKIGVSTEF